MSKVTRRQACAASTQNLITLGSRWACSDCLWNLNLCQFDCTISVDNNKKGIREVRTVHAAISAASNYFAHSIVWTRKFEKIAIQKAWDFAISYTMRHHSEDIWSTPNWTSARCIISRGGFLCFHIKHIFHIFLLFYEILPITKYSDLFNICSFCYCWSIFISQKFSGNNLH